ncbi:hypothetical protein [Streptococcus suis]|uniref:hypothetical protein n=1 Tax=Streptococcus suis TaxID=1307 RepID=UPI001554EE41|nr:hypothetical protein [Streptococcus suis]NQK49620.1 hypothetical protein [Streptococcus suis]NQM02233.1 hypothetical protein [Streptococcus suis]HEM4137373.1 hypothetical protein [Streptococcus suis]HEM5048214.1 hypothetical protein [Streptococcus suis]
MLWISDLSDRLKRILNRKSSNIRALDKGDDTILNFLVYQNGDDSNIMDYDPKFNDILVQEKGLCFKTYYENWENQTFESLLEVEGALELELIFEGEVLSECFGFRNIGVWSSVTKTADYNFRYSSIGVIPEYRGKGVCSCLLLKSIIVVLESVRNNSVEFSLINTVKIEIDDKFSIYNSILTEFIPEERMQYRVFEVENREKDLNQMRELYSQKLEKLYFNLS